WTSSNDEIGTISTIPRRPPPYGAMSPRPAGLRGSPLLTRVDAPGGPALRAVREGLDWLVGIVTGIISFAVYAWSAAPNVTLLDSGEFIVAAHDVWVPPPTGYPLW